MPVMDGDRGEGDGMKTITNRRGREREGMSEREGGRERGRKERKQRKSVSH